MCWTIAGSALVAAAGLVAGIRRRQRRRRGQRRCHRGQRRRHGGQQDLDGCHPTDLPIGRRGQCARPS